MVVSASTVVTNAGGVVVVVSGPSGVQSLANNLFKAAARASFGRLAQGPKLVHFAVLVEISVVTLCVTLVRV